MEPFTYNSTNKPTWCPGCGNFVIHASLKKALTDLNISSSETFISFDIGCNGNGADKITSYGFKGLHGRAIPLAVGAHLANRKFNVIADIGDGGCFHEGLDHLVHAIRSNYNITILIHNNQNFALTTGQATVSTPKNKPMYGLPNGRAEQDLSISEFILNLKPSFYAKEYSNNPLQLTNTLKEAVQNKGLSIIEIMQACPTYNRDFSPQWVKENMLSVQEIENYDPTLFSKAKEAISSTKPTYTGIIYKNLNIPTFYDTLDSRKDVKTELVDEVKEYKVEQFLK